jgi:adenosine kinase
MRIAVVGAIVHDEIVTHLGERRESYGGILYNIAAISSVAEDVTILPITNVGADRYDEVMSLLKAFPSVDFSAIQRSPAKVTHALLQYRSVTYRDETVVNMMLPLTVERLDAAAGSDAVLLNFINGTELDLVTFQKWRSGTDMLLHLDVHSKVARWDEKGKKTHVRFTDWREWMKHVDIAQMNEFEAELVVGRKLSEEADYVGAAAEILGAGPSVAMITLGPLGSVLAYRREDGAYWHACPAALVEKVVDTTGCGDSFSAGFLCNYLQTRDPLVANAAANIVGGKNCETAGIGHLEKARNAAEQIPRAFPDLAQRIAEGWRGNPL